MRLADIGTMAFGGFAARLRRDAIAYSVCALCALAAVAMAAWASILALEPPVGAVYARLIVGGVFAAIAIGAVVAVRYGNPSRPAAMGLNSNANANAGASANGSPRSAQFSQLAMIVEAVMLGYTLSRRSDRR